MRQADAGQQRWGVPDFLVKHEAVPRTQCIHRQDARGAHVLDATSAHETMFEVGHPAGEQEQHDDGQVPALAEARRPQVSTQQIAGELAEQYRPDKRAGQDDSAEDARDPERHRTPDQSRRDHECKQEERDLARFHAVAQGAANGERDPDHHAVAPRAPPGGDQQQNQTAAGGQQKPWEPELPAVVGRPTVGAWQMRRIRWVTFGHDGLRNTRRTTSARDPSCAGR